MSLSVKVEPINRDIQVLQAEGMSPAARSALLAEFAEEAIAEARETNRQALGGGNPRYTQTVDGRLGAPLISVRPDGVIFVEFQLIIDVLIYIHDQLEMHSPVKSGRYKKSHLLFADGREITIRTGRGENIIDADEYVFVNAQPYARKLELGSSTQSPDGVYEAVATMASSQFGRIAKVKFSYRGLVSGQVMGGKLGHMSDVRQPSIVVRVGGGR